MKTNQSKQTKKADYGQEMSGIIIITSILAIVLLTIAFWQFYQYGNQKLCISILLTFTGFIFFFFAIVGVWSSRSGKFILRNKVFGKLEFKGNETVLDLGCGKGLLLIEAAKKLTQGKAFGVDHWVGNLEYKYSAQMVLDNAKIEGVSDRIELVTADAQDLPFGDGSFDVVMTSLMMHHVPDTKKALNEMVRVLKPGGTLVIADINSKRYAPIIQSFGLKRIEIQYATRLFLVPAYIIKGVKS